jgi:hypothetical protein
MHVRPSTPRLLLLAVLLLGALVCTATANAGQRRVVATAAAVHHAQVEAKAAERTVRKQQSAVARACAKHNKKLCRASRMRLQKSSARLSHLRKVLTGLTGSGSTPSTPSTPSSGTSGSKSGSGSKGSKGSTSGSGSGSTSPSGTTGTPVTPPPAGESSFGSVPGSGTFQPGLNSGTTMSTDVAGASTLGAKLVRIEFGIETPASVLQTAIAGYAAKGIRVAPLAGFYGTIPTAAQAKNLASWARAYGPGGTFWAGRSDGALAIRTIEFGNETSYGYQYGDGAGAASYTARAQTYAVRVKEAAEAISATGVDVGVLAQADDWTGDWVNAMYSAVPNLDDYVAGWTIHPYGTNWQNRLQDLVSQTAAHGAPSSIPIDITEWGVATDNGNCLSDNYGMNKCMGYTEAGATVTNTVAAMRTKLGSRLNMFMLYQVRDQASSGTSTDREAYFGALQQNLQPKGAYTTAVQGLLASA